MLSNGAFTVRRENSIIRPQRLLGEGLLMTADRNPLKTSVIIKEVEYTYEQFKDYALRLASALIDFGIEKGDRVAILLNNSWQSVVSIYGISLAGAVFIVVNPQTKSDKLKYILNDSGAKILISDTLLKDELQSSIQEVINLERLILSGVHNDLTLNIPIKIESFKKVILEHEPSFEKLPRVIPVDLAALIYTSGSTGFPKGVMMTHQSMVFVTGSLIEYLRLTEDDRILLVLPLAFDYGLYQLIMAITAGATIIVEESFIFPASIYKQIEKQKPTVFPGVPTIFSMMISTHKKTGLSFKSINKITNTAAALSSSQIPFLKQIFPNALIFKMYGLTECKRVSYLEPELIDKKPDSVGKAIPGTEVFILTHSGARAKPGEPGILYVRGPHIMSGYWNQPELSKEMIKPGLLPWERLLCTNDLFRMDDEGFLYFLSRTDDIIKTRGEKVSPLEIELVLNKLDNVKEAAVIGIPDVILGQSIVAFITLHGKGGNDEQYIKNFCTANLELFMVPQQIRFLDEMPKSSNGKIDKHELTKLV